MGAWAGLAVETVLVCVFGNEDRQITRICLSNETGSLVARVTPCMSSISSTVTVRTKTVTSFSITSVNNRAKLAIILEDAKHFHSKPLLILKGSQAAILARKNKCKYIMCKNNQLC